MKRITLLITLALSGGIATAQSAFPALGGDVSNESGSLSYTVGQVETQYARGRVTNAETQSSTLNEGVQQTYLINDLNIGDIETIAARLYPNPTTDKITVEIDSPRGQYTYSLYTIDGKLLQQKTFSEETIVLDMNAYSSGSYVLRLYREGQESKYRIVKIK